MSILRPALCCLIVGQLLLLPTDSLAEEPVFLRGYLVTPQHVVFGKIESIRAGVAVLNLGFAHGLDAGATLLAVRRVDEELIPISGLTVLQTEADHSRAQVEGPFQAESGDYVLILASHLDLWGGIPRLDRLARERLVRRQSSGGYSTFNASADLIEEIGRDDDYQGRQYQGVKPRAMILEAAEKAGPVRSPIGAVSPLPLLDPSDPEEAAKSRAELDPTIHSLSYFVEIAKSRSLMIQRMTNDRLYRLRTLGNDPDVDENNAPLYREILQTWIQKAILPR